MGTTRTIYMHKYLPWTFRSLLLLRLQFHDNCIKIRILESKPQTT